MMTRVALCVVLLALGCSAEKVGSDDLDGTADLAIDPLLDLASDPSSDLTIAAAADATVDPNADLTVDPNADLTSDPTEDLTAPLADLTGVTGDLKAPVDMKPAADMAKPADMTKPSDMLSTGGGNSAGCGKTSTTGYQGTLTITSQATTRNYALFVPTNYDKNKAYPLVFVFHGSGSNGPAIRNSYKLEAAANNNAIFVYPTAINGNWDLSNQYAANKDLHLFEDLTASIAANYCIADDRVFATGYSNGGYFSNILNCRLGRAQIRAIAAHAGSVFGWPKTSDGHVVCQGEATGALMSHGTNDGVVKFVDGEYAREQWRWANECSTATTAYTPSPCTAFTGCKAGHPVVWCPIPDIGHGLWNQAAAVTWTYFDGFK